MYYDTLLFLNTLTALNSLHLLEQKGNPVVDYFYQQNQVIGAIGLSNTIQQEGHGSELFVNRYFMTVNRLTASRIDAFLQATYLDEGGNRNLAGTTGFYGIVNGTAGYATSPVPFSIVKNGSLSTPEPLVPLQGILFALESSETEWFFSWKAAV